MEAKSREQWEISETEVRLREKWSRVRRESVYTGGQETVEMDRTAKYWNDHAYVAIWRLGYYVIEGASVWDYQATDVEEYHPVEHLLFHPSHRNALHRHLREKEESKINPIRANNPV